MNTRKDVLRTAGFSGFKIREENQLLKTLLKGAVSI